MARLTLVGLFLIVAFAPPAAARDSSPPPRHESVDAIVEDFSPPAAAAIARQFRALNPQWKHMYGQYLQGYADEWCYRNSNDAVTHIVNHIWLADTRAVPVLLQLEAYLAQNCPYESSRFLNMTAYRFSNLVQRGVSYQFERSLTRWRLPAPRVPRPQHEVLSQVSEIACSSGVSLVTDWVKHRYSVRWAWTLLAEIAADKVFCGPVLNRALATALG